MSSRTYLSIVDDTVRISDTVPFRLATNTRQKRSRLLTNVLQYSSGHKDRFFPRSRAIGQRYFWCSDYEPKKPLLALGTPSSCPKMRSLPVTCARITMEKGFAPSRLHMTRGLLRCPSGTSYDGGENF